MTFSPLIEAELSRIAAKKPLTAIDLSRYEGSPSPSDIQDADDRDGASTSKAAQIHELKKSYTNATYLAQRTQALELLEQFGKNAWLVGNSQLEGVLGGVERELVGVREEVEGVNRGRREGQEVGRGGLEGGEREWRGGVGGVVRAGVAVRGVEEEVRGALRKGGG